MISRLTRHARELLAINGLGLQPIGEQAHSIDFGEGETRNSASEVQGSGLGLAIATQSAISSNMIWKLSSSPSDIYVDAKVKIKTN